MCKWLLESSNKHKQYTILCKLQWDIQYSRVCFISIYTSTCVSHASDIISLFHHSQMGRECYNLAVVCNAVLLNMFIYEMKTKQTIKTFILWKTTSTNSFADIGVAHSNTSQYEFLSASPQILILLGHLLRFYLEHYIKETVDMP